jgi:hypothetical protein
MPTTSVAVTTLSGTAAGVTWPASDGTACDVANENHCLNSATLCIMAKNTGASSYTLTFRTPAKAGSLDVAEDIKTLAAGAQKVFGPFPRNIYGDTLVFAGENVAVKVIPFQSVQP